MPAALDEAVAFAARALRPDRPRLSALLAQLSGLPEADCAHALALPSPWDRVVALGAARGHAWSGHTSPAEAWEALAPASWIEAPGRAFLGDLYGSGPLPHPATLRDGLSLAADPAGIEAAECIGRELTRALRLPGVDPERVQMQWCAVDPTRWRARCLGVAPEDALDGPRLRARLSPDRDGEAEVIAAVIRACAPRLGGAAFDAAQVAGWSLRADDPRDETLPLFRHLYDLWNLGYALHALRPEALVFVAPRL